MSKIGAQEEVIAFDESFADDALSESFAEGNSSKSWEEVIGKARAAEDAPGLSESQQISLKRETEVLEAFQKQTEYKQRLHDPFYDDIRSSLLYCWNPDICESLLRALKDRRPARWLIIFIGAFINAISTFFEMLWFLLLIIWSLYALYSMGPY